LPAKRAVDTTGARPRPRTLEHTVTVISPGELRVAFEAVQRVGVITELRDARARLEGVNGEPPPRSIDPATRRKQIVALGNALDTILPLAPASPFQLVTPTWLTWDLAVFATTLALGQAEAIVDEFHLKPYAGGGDTRLETVRAAHAWTGTYIALLETVAHDRVSAAR
jgi:hypothetical protein